MKFCIIFFVFIFATVPVLLCSWMYNPFSFQLTIKMQLIIIRIRIYFICPPRQLIVRLKIELSQLWQCLYVDMLATLTVCFYHIFSSYFVFLSVILRNTEKVHLHQNTCNLFVSPFCKRSFTTVIRNLQTIRHFKWFEDKLYFGGYIQIMFT